MKTTGLTKKRGSLITLGLAASIFLAGANFGLAQSAQIGARPLTPQEIHDLGLTNVYASGGLMTVGVGESVYLEAKVETGTVVNGVTWSIESRPLAVPPSAAVLQDSPLPDDLPIYSPGDRYVLDLAGRKLFVPDVPGQFLIQAVVTTNSGSLVLQSKVTSAMYTGAGNIANANPVYPQCALCHQGNAIGWLETGHASFFEEAIDGIKSSHYGEDCTHCHVLGGHNPEAQNNNFWNVAASLPEPWTFPDVLQPGNWDAMPSALKAKASIQCEHCHGAGSEHHGDKTAISVSFNAGDCGQCHDEAPYHNKNREWLNSTHARVTDYPTGEGRGSCIKCHTAMGFVGTLDGKTGITTDYEAISCAACHDPHDAGNHGQLRTVADVTLQNG
ncbi:MAG TPA: hypothetical protein VK995_05600, partial [Oceanipulchritudo sp.]|nr:hypothetical protein [Oceanipulchritudo sp.]